MTFLEWAETDDCLQAALAWINDDIIRDTFLAHRDSDAAYRQYRDAQILAGLGEVG